MALLSVERLAKRFSGVVAVKEVSLAVDSGEILGLFGPNGAGKTTMFNLIAGALYPDAGRILFEGEEITRLAAFRRARLGIGRTFQLVRPFRALTVAENLLAAVPRAGAGEADPEALLAEVGLAERRSEPSGALTLGMLKRLEVARALALGPKLLLLDEPLAGLTAKEASDLLAFIATLRARAGIIMVEHNVRLSLPLCDRAVVMDAGAVIADGTPAAIRAHPEVIRAYLGQAED